MAYSVEKLRLVELAAQITVSSIESGQLKPKEVHGFVAETFKTLEALIEPVTPETVQESAPLRPAISIEQSVTPDYIICLEDGKRFKSMRGHLRKLGMTPDEYRAKWGLPENYPVVATSYAAKRSEMAIASRLGKQRRSKSPSKDATEPQNIAGTS